LFREVWWEKDRLLRMIGRLFDQNDSFWGLLPSLWWRFNSAVLIRFIQVIPGFRFWPGTFGNPPGWIVIGAILSKIQTKDSSLAHKLACLAARFSFYKGWFSPNLFPRPLFCRHLWWSGAEPFGGKSRWLACG
jgi:hypothetical protein